MNFPLSTAFIVSLRFGYVVPSFSLNSKKILISFFISSLTQECFSSWLFSFHEFVGFWGWNCCLILTLLHGDPIRHWWLLQFFCICGSLLCYPVCGQFSRRFHELQRRRYILSFLGRIFYRYLLSPFDSLPLAILLFLCCFCLIDLFIDERSVLKSPTISVCGLMTALSSKSFSFT